IVSRGPFIADRDEEIQDLYYQFRHGKMMHINEVADSQKIQYLQLLEICMQVFGKILDSFSLGRCRLVVRSAPFRRAYENPTSTLPDPYENLAYPDYRGVETIQKAGAGSKVSIILSVT